MENQLWEQSELLGVTFTYGPDADVQDLTLYYVQGENLDELKFPDDYTLVDFNVVHPDNFEEVIRCREQLKSRFWKGFKQELIDTCEEGVPEEELSTEPPEPR